MRNTVTIFAAIGLIYIALNLIIALGAPYFAPHIPTQILGGAWEAPSFEHILGLDNLGRDIFSRLIYGAANSIGIALLVSLLSFAIGLYAGIFSGIKGGKMDLFLSRLFELFLSMPTLIFVLMVLTVFGTSLSILVLTLGFIDSTRVFRLARLLAQQTYAKDYIEAALLRGEGYIWLMRREILPNVLPALLAEFGLRFSFVFLLVAALSYLGLGIQPPEADWGNMIRDNAPVILLGKWPALYPAIAIALLAASINVVVDWLTAIRSR